MTYRRWQEEGHCGCGVGVIYRGIPHGGACHLDGGAHGGGGQYPWPEGGGGGVLEPWLGWSVGGDGGQYPLAGGGGGHVRGCLTVGDPLHGITGGGSI
jgi:hypothetical protein